MHEADVNPGTLIVFEGIDGCGKSTQLRLAAAALRERGLDVIETCEPTDGPWGQKIRAMAKTEEGVSPDVEFDWFFRDRAEHMQRVVDPAVEAGKIVLSDRSYVSSVAYQGARGLDPQDVLDANQAAYRSADLILVFEIPVETSLARIEARGGTREPAFEKQSFLEKVSKIFETLELAGLVRIDASRSEDAIHADVMAAIDQRLA